MMLVQPQIHADVCKVDLQARHSLMGCFLAINLIPDNDAPETQSCGF